MGGRDFRGFREKARGLPQALGRIDQVQPAIDVKCLVGCRRLHARPRQQLGIWQGRRIIRQAIDGKSFGGGLTARKEKHESAHGQAAKHGAPPRGRDEEGAPGKRGRS